MRYYLLAGVLLALLLGDVISTVVFIELGVPEANGLIEPIADSYLHQLIYKAPFALVLVGALFLTARVCDRKVPGSGVCAWLPVLLLYTVPVVHNCAIIMSL